MADIVILKRKHFAEDVKPAAWSDAKWAGRPRQGDVVEVQPTGFFRIEALGPTSGTHGWDKDAFAVIRLTNVDYLSILHFAERYLNPTATVGYKNRYRFAAWTDIPWTVYAFTDGGTVYEEWSYVRTNLTGLAALALTDKVTA